jgi:membrane protein required for colicin V production
MAIIDIVLGALLLLGIIRGLMKGLFVEVASLAALILGIYGAIHFSNFAAEFFESRVEWDEQYLNIAAFAITFIIIVMVISLAGKALTKIADFAALGILNRFLGALFGVIKIALILSVVLIILDKTNKSIPILGDDDLEKSVLYEQVKGFAPMVFPVIIEKINFEDTVQAEK